MRPSNLFRARRVAPLAFSSMAASARNFHKAPRQKHYAVFCRKNRSSWMPLDNKHFWLCVLSSCLLAVTGCDPVGQTVLNWATSGNTSSPQERSTTAQDNAANQSSQPSPSPHPVEETGQVIDLPDTSQH